MINVVMHHAMKLVIAGDVGTIRTMLPPALGGMKTGGSAEGAGSSASAVALIREKWLINRVAPYHRAGVFRCAEPTGV